MAWAFYTPSTASTAATAEEFNYDTAWSSDTPVEVVSTATETLLIDMNVVAATHYTDKSRIIIQYWGDWLHNNSTGDTVTVKVRTGTTSAATAGVVLGAALQTASNQIGSTRSMITGQIHILVGDSREMYLNGYIAARRPTGGVNNDGGLFIPGDSGLNSPPITAGASDTNLKVTATWSASSSNNSYKLDGYRAWWIKGS